MFFYRFGDQRTHNIYQSHHTSKPGDLICFNDEYYLNLGEDISRPEQGSTTIHFTGEKIIPKFCTIQTLTLLHRMVNERFSSYNKCIPLFFGNDINLLLKHKVASKKQKVSKVFYTQIDKLTIGGHPSPVKDEGTGVRFDQELMIFPSVFSLTQYLNNSETIVSPSYHNHITTVLTGQSTTVARAKAYRSITNNTNHILYATHSQIFQNRHHLTAITVIDPYSPLYQTYQDPRYNLDTVIKKIREVYSVQ